MKKILTLLATVGVLLAGLMTGSQAHEGETPHAEKNWFGFECILYNDIDGPVSSNWGFGGENGVVREYSDKVVPLPKMRYAESIDCNGGDVGHVQVNQVTGVAFCSKFDPGFGGGEAQRITVNADCLGNGRAREFACSAVGSSVGNHFYRTTDQGVAKGCMWTGAGPDHVSDREDQVLTAAWN